LRREQHYLDLLKPEYNIHPTAGSSIGYRHTEETKQAIRDALKGRQVSEETRGLQREARLGAKISEETRAKLRVIQSTRLNHPNPGKEVKDTDINTGETTIYDSTRSAARELGTSHGTIRNYIKSKKLFQGVYQLTFN
jgi:group I intron endonuclease